MRRIILVLVAVVALYSSSDRAWAWNSAGHMLIAAEAFRDLPPPFKFKTFKILEAHPEYKKWEKAFGVGRWDVDLQTYLFMRASAWPDENRKMENKYEHPHWYYISYPLKPPSFPMEPAPAPDDDLLYGIGQCERVLCDTNATPESQAVHLSWLIHLIGDVHEPLHCATLFDGAYPKGDNGGEEFYVKFAGKPVTLRAFWDDLLGTRPNTPTQFHAAIQVVADHPKKSLPKLINENTPKDWSLASRTLAIHKVYLIGELKGSTRPDTAPALPPDYFKTAKTAAEKQAALAGYRLSAAIQKCVH